MIIINYQRLEITLKFFLLVGSMRYHINFELCVCECVGPVQKIQAIWLLNFILEFSWTKDDLYYILVLSELFPFVDLFYFEIFRVKFCKQDIWKSVCAKGL